MKTTLVNSNRNLAGTYIKTEIDIKKENIRFLLTSISGKYYNIFDRVEKRNIEIIGKKSFQKFAKENNYLTDL
jgi:hypothetical protein